MRDMGQGVKPLHLSSLERGCFGFSVALSLLACASPPPPRVVTPDLYVTEFLTDRKSSIAPEGWRPKERLMHDEQLIVALRERSAEVLAVAIFHSGYHPRWTVVFVRSRAQPSSVRIIATLTFWGSLKIKRFGEMTFDSFDRMRDDLAGRLECGVKPKRPDMYWGFSHWRDGTTMYCGGEILGESAEFFYDTIRPAMDLTVLVYDVWEETQ